MKLKKEDIKKLYLEVRDLTNNFKEINPTILLKEYPNSEYKPSQRLVIFRCILGYDSNSFAKLFGRKAGVFSNWESGCRYIKSIETSKEYVETIVKEIRFKNIDLNLILKGWETIRVEIKDKRGERARNMTFEEHSRMGKIGGKIGDKNKKRTNLINNISKQPPTNYEKMIISFLENKGLSYELHPVIGGECFDFKINNIIIEAEDQRQVGHAYHKAHRMNIKAKKLRAENEDYAFLAIVPPNTAPEVIKKLAEEYIIYIYPEEPILKKYVDVMELINKGYNLPETTSCLKVNTNSMRSRFKKLLKYKLIEKQKEKYRNKWKVTSSGMKFLKDFYSSEVSSFEEILKGKIKEKNNEWVLKLSIMKYWLFANPSGHITKTKFLDSSEKKIKRFLKKENIKHFTQYPLYSEIEGYPIKRLVDEFIPSNKVIEVKTIDINKKYAFSKFGGTAFELVGEALRIKDFYPLYKVYAVILGKNKKINKLPIDVTNWLSNYVDGIYTDSSIKEIKYVI
ncbi:MAG TPA: hypothetical protein VJB94_02365 [Candidatus Nanoarchaeia archaeon]|nr:hypothetical protein [Candidatus Nanoarchaeia archaeon]